MRLIDAEALMERLPDEWKKFPDRDYRDTTGSTIASMPTIDPVKHGHWEENPYWAEIPDGKYMLYSCSLCHVGDIYLVGRAGRYCPNCGALMGEKAAE